MEAMLTVVVEPRSGTDEKKKKKKTKLAREPFSKSSSSRYPSMPRYPPSPSHGEIVVSEIRKATFNVRQLFTRQEQRFHALKSLNRDRDGMRSLRRLHRESSKATTREDVGRHC